MTETMTLQGTPLSIAEMITVKNTFLDVKKSADQTVRRSNSVPRTFRPGVHVCYDSFDKTGDSPAANSANSDDSTSASDKDVPDYCSDCTCNDCDDIGLGWGCLDSVADASDDKEASRITLSLADLTEGQEKARAKLRTQARPFKSARTQPAEVAAVVSSAVEALSSCEGICDVKVQQGGMGDTTVIMAKTWQDLDTSYPFSLAKDALLHAAELSESTYIMGYGARPFNNLDACSFSANIGLVPAAHADTACWDTYEKGYCPRPQSCI